MARIKVTGDDGQIAGWFDGGKAQRRWTDRDHDGHGAGGPGRGTALWLTAGGRWVREEWTDRQGEASRYEFVAPEVARAWLLAHGEDAAVEQHFGPLGEERVDVGGRPGVDAGEPGIPILVRVTAAQLRRLDQQAAAAGVSRAEIVRRHLDAAAET